MKICITYRKDASVIKSEPGGKISECSTLSNKTYESDDIDEEIKNASAGKAIDRFTIQDLQLTSAEQVNDAIDMLMGVAANISRGNPFKASVTPKDFPMDESVNLHDTFDARIWASEFCKRFNADEDLMLSWFANAIMAGSDDTSRKAISAIKELLDLDYGEGVYYRGWLNGLDKALSILEGRDPNAILEPNTLRIKAIHVFRDGDNSSVYHGLGYENVDDIVLRDGKFLMLRNGVTLREVKEDSVDQVDYVTQ